MDYINAAVMTDIAIETLVGWADYCHPIHTPAKLT